MGHYYLFHWFYELFQTVICVVVDGLHDIRFPQGDKTQQVKHSQISITNYHYQCALQFH